MPCQELLLLTLNKLPPYSIVLIANFEQFFISWYFISRVKSVMKVCGGIIYIVVGLAPRFLGEKALFVLSKAAYVLSHFRG